MNRCLILLLLLPAAPSAAQGVSTPPDAEPLTLEQALELARAHNPTIAAARLRRAVDQAGVDVARERPNPEARYERTNELPHDALSVAQLVELGGKRSRRIALAEAALQTGLAEQAQTEAEVVADTTLAYYDLAGAQRSADLTRELQDIARRLRNVAAERHEVGDVPRFDVLQADLAYEQSENEATAAAGERVAAQAALNGLIGRDLTASTVAAEEVDVPPPAAAVATVAALAHNTALAVLDRQVAEAQARAAVARAARVPDPTIEGTVTHDAQPEFTWGWRAAVAVVIPLFTRHNAAVRVEEGTALLLRARRDALAQRIRGSVAAAAARAAAARQQYLRYRDEILPHSREVEKMAEESYREGQTNLVTLLQTLQAARELRGRALQSAADFQAALATLRQAMSVGPK